VQDATADELEMFGSLKGNRCPPGHFIADGIKTVRRMLASGLGVKLVTSAERLGELSVPDGVEVKLATRDALEQVLGYEHHSGVLGLGRIPAERPLAGTLHVAFDGISNAENVGAILRTCAAFGADGVVWSKRSASPWMRRAVRVSVGAPLVIATHEVPDIAEFVRSRNAWAAHIHGERRDYREVDLTAPVTLVLGSEADGVSEDVLKACRGTIYIPMASSWDCLNVAASAAVLLAEVRRQRDAARC
jgi:tRNA G18 (ribose-2'-O)-methylase SpoU